MHESAPYIAEWRVCWGFWYCISVAEWCVPQQLHNYSNHTMDQDEVCRVIRRPRGTCCGNVCDSDGGGGRCNDLVSSSFHSHFQSTPAACLDGFERNAHTIIPGLRVVQEWPEVAPLAPPEAVLVSMVQSAATRKWNALASRQSILIIDFWIWNFFLTNIF